MLISRESREQPAAEVITDVFAGKPIGIFESAEKLQSKEDTLKTWTKLEKHDLRLRLSMAPRNYFEKMAYWTEEGKIWKFPIDNEQGNFRNIHFSALIFSIQFVFLIALNVILFN